MKREGKDIEARTEALVLCPGCGYVFYSWDAELRDVPEPNTFGLTSPEPQCQCPKCGEWIQEDDQW